MPHAVFDLQSQTGSGDFLPRELIPGVTPGGQFAGKRKPALIIEDAWVEIIDYTVDGATDFNAMGVLLKLSQSLDLNPGLVLPIATIGGQSLSGASTFGVGQSLQENFKAQGTVWAPRAVGVRLAERGTMTLNLRVHLEFSRLFMEWRDWFVHWEFLDNIVDNERQF